MIEILSKDLLGRIARFRTKTGLIETPAFLPVVHPSKILIPPRQFFEDFKCPVIITNAYLLFKEKLESKVHTLLDFPGSIMTDSGGYQLLVYGDVDVTPTEIIQFQERIESDIAVILDVPTGGRATYQQAKATVEETIKRAKESISIRDRSDILWVAPIQGGTYPDLVAGAAQQLSELAFSVFAIGSPTQLMERYQFGPLVDLIIAARRNLPVHKPIHLFGAGHPLIFPLIVALGCDMFDSAAYAIYARNDRLLTPDGTYRLVEIHEEVCDCPTCSLYTISEIKELERAERTRVLAEHNLHICFREIARIKQAIREGRLWRLVESRISSHPSLVDAMNRLTFQASYIERFSPVTKRRAIFISSEWSLFQPEVLRHQTKVANYTSPSVKRNTLMLLAAPRSRPYHSAPRYLYVLQLLKEYAPSLLDRVHIIFLSPYFGIVPIEISGVYPLAQNETPSLPLPNWIPRILSQLSKYLLHNVHYSTFLGILPQEADWKNFSRAFHRLLKRQLKAFVHVHTNFSRASLSRVIQRIIKKQSKSIT